MKTKINNSTIRNPQPELPTGWKWVRLGEVCEKPQYGYTASADYNVKGPKFLRITDIQKGNVNWNNVPYCRCENEIYRYLLKSGDILFARTGGTTGKSYLIEELLENTIFASYLIRVRTSKDIGSEYLYLYLQSSMYWNQVEINKRGGAQPNMNATLLSNVILPLPQLSEQKRIVTKIQELLQEIDKARTTCEKQLEAVNALPSAYLREVFESEESKKWERKRLGEVLEVIESGSRPKGGVLKITEGIPSIGAEHLNSFGGFNFSNIRFIPEDFYQEMKRGKIKKNDVLVVKDGATTGKVSFVRDNFPYNHSSINEHVFILRGKVFLVQEFLFWFLYSTLGQRQIMQEFHGAAQGGINQQFVNGVYLSIPNIDIQQRIVFKLQEKMLEVEKLRNSIEKQLEAINALPQAILSKAFKGEL